MFLVGFSTGSAAFLLEELEEILRGFTKAFLDPQFIQTKGVTWAFIAFAALASSYGLIAGLMTTYFGPAASGSGVAELIGYLNGVNYPNFLGIKTLLTKIVGVALAVNAKLVVGKEGPLAHIGSNLGAMVLYIPGLGFEFLRNDDKKRQYIAAGAAVGVSAAFGAPVGGTLFLYEFSKPNTFWTIDMVSKVFFACCVGTLTLYAWISTFNEKEHLAISSLKFGTGAAANEN
jgi:H+/Cl- antiporter ClcA